MRRTKEGGLADWTIWFGLLLGIWAVGALAGVVIHAL